jgi:hypothetical protein
MRKQLLKFVAAAAILTSAAGAATPVQNQKFVAKLYADLLNRNPSRIESATFTTLLNLGATRTQIAGAITSSKEYRTDQIQQDFASFLNRPATAGEVSFFLNYLQQGATDDDVKAAILGGDEYYRLAGGTDYGFLNKLFEDVLGRPVDRGAESTLAALMRQGTTRQAIAELILHSLEADQREVTQLFQKLLHRLPQPAELAADSQMLLTGATDEFVIDALCGSDEYFQLAQ